MYMVPKPMHMSVETRNHRSGFVLIVPKPIYVAARDFTKHITDIPWILRTARIMAAALKVATRKTDEMNNKQGQMISTTLCYSIIFTKRMIITKLSICLPYDLVTIITQLMINAVRGNNIINNTIYFTKMNCILKITIKKKF